MYGFAVECLRGGADPMPLRARKNHNSWQSWLVLGPWEISGGVRRRKSPVGEYYSPLEPFIRSPEAQKKIYTVGKKFVWFLGRPSVDVNIHSELLLLSD